MFIEKVGTIQFKIYQNGKDSLSGSQNEYFLILINQSFLDD